MGSLTVADAEVGKRYKLTVCGANPMLTNSSKKYDVEITARTETHTYLKHRHGDMALPNNTGIDLIELRLK